MKKEVITFKEPKSPISEIFRNLRTSVQFANNKRGLHTLLVTSTNPGEGKSWVSVNLAVTFAQAGKKVILVDCDMRKGRQFSIFDVPPTPGLSNYLSGVTSDGEESSESILSYIKETPVDNLFVIPAGNVPPNPSELLISDAMMQAMDDLKMISDIVIFDGTPCNLVTDSVIISRMVDTTLIVSAYKSTKIDELQNLKKSIESVGGKIAGVIINKTKVTQKQYYSSYYYGKRDDKEDEIERVLVEKLENIPNKTEKDGKITLEKLKEQAEATKNKETKNQIINNNDNKNSSKNTSKKSNKDVKSKSKKNETKKIEEKLKKEEEKIVKELESSIAEKLNGEKGEE